MASLVLLLLLGCALLATSATGAAASPGTAYVTNFKNESVTPIELATGKAGPVIKVGADPIGVAITPDGRTAYIADSFVESVTPIEVATNKPGPAIKVGKEPEWIAITPDGVTAYVTNYLSESVTPIDIATNTPGTAIKVGKNPSAVAVTPDGRTVYVDNEGGESVTPIDIATNEPGPVIKVGKNPQGIAITPDGRTAYVTNDESASVTPIDLATNTPGTAIGVGLSPESVAITPDGRTAYVVNEGSESVTPIDVATNKPGPAIKVGKNPRGIAIAPNAGTAYVDNNEGASVTPIDLATNMPSAEIKVGEGPWGIAITPPAAPAVVTGGASALSQTSATLDALVDPNGGLVGECKFEYGASAAYGSTAECTPSPGFGPGPVAVSAAVAGLSANTEYHFRISATNQGGTSAGLDRTFTTLPLPQLVAALAPTITGARLTHSRFRVGKQSTAVSAAKKPVGTSFRFTLSAIAKIQITITRSASGLRRGHRCEAPSIKLRRAHARRCTRTLTVAVLTRASEAAGPDSVSFSGRIGGHPLSPRTYNAVLRASDPSGHSRPVTLSFTIVR